MPKSRKKQQQGWSICHIQYVIDNYKTRKYEDIGKHLGRSLPAVSDLLRRIGIGAGKGRRKIKQPAAQNKQRRRFTPEARAMLFRETHWLR